MHSQTSVKINRKVTFFIEYSGQKVKILLSPTLPPPYFLSPFFKTFVTHPPKINELNTHICRIKGLGRCGVAPPPIIFERLKLSLQIIYRRKENLSESPNHKKYWENILVSRFYEQFLRNRRNLGHFRKFEKISNS